VIRLRFWKRRWIRAPAFRIGHDGLADARPAQRDLTLQIQRLREAKDARRQLDDRTALRLIDRRGERLNRGNRLGVETESESGGEER